MWRQGCGAAGRAGKVGGGCSSRVGAGTAGRGAAVAACNVSGTDLGGGGGALGGRGAGG